MEPGAIINYLWLGFRPENAGLTNFESLWECEDGTIVDVVDTALQADVAPINGVNDASPVGALGNDSLRCTFAVDPTLIERFHVTVNDVCTAAGHADFDHQQGEYLILLRCRIIGAGGVAGVQMRSGYTGQIIHEEVYVDNTDWHLIPLGNISIPP